MRRRPGHPPLLETELAAHVVAWLESDSWDVYQEVDGADIVAVRGPVLWVVECKTSMGFAVLGQAMARRAEAHCVWVATPYRKSDRAVVRSFCSYAGVGWIEVFRDGRTNVRERPEFNRRATSRLRGLLRPEHKTYAKAGSPTGRAWTPYKETCRSLLLVVSSRPGIPLRDAVKSVKHHYGSDSSAVRTLVKRIESGAVPGVRAERSGKSFLLFPSG